MKSGDIFVFSKTGKLTTKFDRQKLGGESLFDEKWLQEVLFENIDLIKAADPAYDRIRIIPLCRELSLNDGFRNLFLDILAVTETGKLVLIECKLWKNPQARREVLAQTLEYASLMQKLSYSDLAAKLKKHIPSGSSDPIAYLFNEKQINFDEGLLIDRIVENMRRGNFHLIIAGDGIRGDLANLVNSSVMSGMTAELTLLEIAVHQNQTGEILLSPSVPSETETITRTVLVSAEGMPAIIEEDFESDTSSASGSSVSKPMQKEIKEANSAFWSRAMASISFDHPDQEPLRRGGNNWCKALLPDPLKWITAWRTKDRLGVFLRISNDDLNFYQSFFEERLEAMKAEVSPDIRIETPEEKNGWAEALFVSVALNDIDTLDPKTEETQIKWLSDHLNRFVNFLRPLINELAS